MSTLLALDMPLADSTLTAVLGYCVVFFGLVLLMLVISIVGKSFAAAAKKETASQEQTAPEAPKEDAPLAPGTAGEVKLHNVPPKTAAMLMAIVANKLQKPINELRFISIKEVE